MQTEPQPPPVEIAASAFEPGPGEDMSASHRMALEQHAATMREAAAEQALALDEILKPVVAPRGFFARLLSIFAPQPSRAELTIRLLSAWTIGKPMAADEYTQKLAALTVEQVFHLTGGR